MRARQARALRRLRRRIAGGTGGGIACVVLGWSNLVYAELGQLAPQIRLAASLAPVKQPVERQHLSAVFVMT
jgi:hypothetical protein